MKHFLALCLTLVCFAIGAEVRAVWVLPWDITTPAAIDEVIKTAVENNQNELLVEVRYRSDALFDTSKGATSYPNPEPISYVMKGSRFDPLAYILEEAHARGLNVQAWVIVFNATPSERTLIQQNYIYQNHRDWLTSDRNGNMQNGSKNFGYFIDPGVPEAQDYLLDVISNLAAGYPDLDGIHLDYIRYPEQSLGFNPVSVARYEEYCRNQEEISFNDWRMMQVSSFVERMHKRLEEINPRMMLSAAVFADISEATVAYAQDWPNWLRKGIIDRIYPMAYNRKLDTHKSQVERMKLIGHDQDIVIGIRAWDDKNRSLTLNGGTGYTVADIAKRISHARELGFGGVAMFSLAGLKIGNAWQQLTRLSFLESVPYPGNRKESNLELLLADLDETEESGNLEAAIPIVDAKIPAADFFAVTPKDEELQLPISADFRILKKDTEFIINLILPYSGNWSWELYTDQLLFQTSRHYNKGENYEWWDGQLNNSRDELAPGSYIVHLFSDDAPYKYIIPVEVPAN